jgi:tripartite-type tricarboxylate transporter receptor subunit TctC
MVKVLVTAGLVLSGFAPAWAADFPQKGKTIQMFVGFAAGGSTDVASRILASGMEKELGTPVVVVNKPGASSQISYTALA